MSRRANGEGSKPVLRKDGRYAVSIRYLDPAGLSKRTTVYGRTAKEARDKAATVRERLAQKKPPKDSSMLLSTFASEWISTTLAVSDRKTSTKAMYAALARKHIVEDDLGRRSLDRVLPRNVEGWIAALRSKGLSESTVRSTYTVLRAILDTAVRDRAIAENPAAVVKRPKVESKEAAFLTPDDVERLLVASEGSRYAPLFRLLINTGLRRGEALALRWSDVNMAERTIRVAGTLSRENGGLVMTSTKTAKSKRTLYMTDETKAILDSVKSRQRRERLAAGSMWVDSGFVFATELGEPSDPRNALRALKVAAERAGLPGVGLHTLRHSAASVLLTKGVPLKVVSEILGHSSTAITGDVYGHVAPDVAAEAMRVLSGVVTA